MDYSSTMKFDCGFSKENKKFRYRIGGFIINGNKILFVKTKFGNYYYMIGGAVNIGETSKACIEREILEETGMTVCADRLVVLCENFFKGHGGNIEGYDCHTIEFYYHITVSREELLKCKDITDDGEKLVWLTIDEVKASNIKPIFIKERIDEIINCSNVIHIIEERDR